MPTPAISIRGLTKTFGSKVAVSNLDLDVPSGSLCGFIGPNGAGKTTTIRMVMSIIFPDSGELSVLGKASAIESKDRIGYLPEERGVYRKMKVLPFLIFMARLKDVDAGAARRKSMEWLGRMGLGDVARKKCEELSKGMQQKVQFISAVIHEPDLLILDEVFSGLDPENRRMMRGLIEEQHRSGRTIVFSTHSMYEAEQLCDRVVMICQGEKVLDDSMAGIRARFDPRTIIVEPLGGRAVAATGAANGDAGEPLERSLRNLPGVSHVEPDRDGYSVGLAEGTDPSRIMADVVALTPVRRIELKRVNLEDVFMDLVRASGNREVKRDDLRAPADAEVSRV
ncbi:MAG TPA: ATP-binding cassette domain-containing protein [Phycisphaerales bacterium]|nr:ATP-binding cassette domain-containing protein [Phycisphaerales bacterium]